MYSLIGFVSEQLGDEIRSCTGSLWIANETELSYPASPSTFIQWGKLIALPLYENSYINNVIFIFLRIRKLFVYFGLQYEVLNQKSNVKSNIFIGILLLFQRQNFLSLLLFNIDLGRRRKGTFAFSQPLPALPLAVHNQERAFSGSDTRKPSALGKTQQFYSEMDTAHQGVCVQGGSMHIWVVQPEAMGCLLSTRPPCQRKENEESSDMPAGHKRSSS